MNRLAGTDGIRGKVGADPFTVEGALEFGLATGTALTGGDGLVIVHDPRQSSEQLGRSIAFGILGAGTDAHFVGMGPTPMGAYLAREWGASGAVVVSASHNPADDNGYKLMNGAGGKLDEPGWDAVQQHFAHGTQIPRHWTEWGKPYETDKGIDQYAGFLRANASEEAFRGINMVMDTANGAASHIGPQVLRDLGARVTPIFNTPDGRNINEGCGATDMAALTASVLEHNESRPTIGVAYDGDADRMFLVDEKGRVLNGDHALGIFAACGGPAVKSVVGTIMTNEGLALKLQENGQVLHRTDVGDHNVFKGMQSTGSLYGAEQSGHIIVPGLDTGDGILASIRLLDLVRNSGKSLAEWYDALPMLDQHTENVPTNLKHLLGHEAVVACIEQHQLAMSGRGMVLVRPSGTEDKVRITVQAPGAQDIAQRVAADVQAALQNIA